MNKKLAIVLLALAFAVGTAGTVMAISITGTNHDMIAHEGVDAEQGTCSFCHVPHGASGAKLFAPGAGGANATGIWANDAYAGVCFYCHGAGGTFNNGDATINLNVFDGSSHQNLVDRLAGGIDPVNNPWSDIAVVGDLASIPGYYTTAGESFISCISCHNVHDNAVRPYLRDNGAGAGIVNAQLQTLCDDCHIERVADAGVGDRLNHPSMVSLDGNSVGGTLLTDASLYTYAVAMAANANSVFDGTWSDTAIKMTNATIANTEHWNSGAKFQDTDLDGTSDDIFDCNTCHMTHGNEEDLANYARGDGLGVSTAITGAAVDWGFNNMTVASPLPVAAVAGVGGGAAPICVACHDITTDVPAGPGLPGTVSHPYSGAFGAFTVNDPGRNARFGGSLADPATRAIACQSCHDMHFSDSTYAQSTSATQDFAMINSYCEDCHSGANAEGFQANHHPTGTFAPGTDFAAAPVVSTDVSWDIITRADITSNTLTKSNSATAYPIAGNVIGCGTCHLGDAGTPAHNQVGATWVPGLLADTTEDRTCVDCHGINPGAYTPTVAGADGSHYVGSIMTVGYKWGYGISTNVDGVDTLASAGANVAQYASDSSADGDLICTSCHNLRHITYNLQWSDNGDGGTPAPGTNYSDGARVDGNTDGELGTKDGIGLLLAPAGNDALDALADSTDYLCTACHGESPGGGVTHPVLPSYTTAATATTVAPNANTPNNFVTLNAANQINCESCHRAHDADTQGGTYILEIAGGTGQGGYIDEAVLCNACHVQ